MTGFKKFLQLVAATGFLLVFFSPSFPMAPEMRMTNFAEAKKKTSRKVSKKKKKQIKKNQAPIFPVKLIGNADCVRKTNAALEVLQKKSPDDFQQVIQNLGIVECAADGSGTFVWENTVRFKAGFATYQADVLWYASVLVHESCHARQYKDYLLSHPGKRVPTETFSGAEAENDCLSDQHNCLSRLEAGQMLLDYTKKIAATNYWDAPYEKRWW